MKQIGILVVVAILLASLVFGAVPESLGGQGAQGPKEGVENTIAEGAEANAGTQNQEETQTQEQNMGEETQIQNQVRAQNIRTIMAGEYTSEDGKQIRVQEQANNRIQLRVGEASADTSLEVVQEQVQERTRLSAKLSNGKNAEIKVMPDTASETALARLRLKVCSEENGCTIELKEVGQGEQVRAAYEVQAQKEAKVLGIFKAKMQVRAQVDAENGEIIRTQKPWWAFLAAEPEQ